MFGHRTASCRMNTKDEYLQSKSNIRSILVGDKVQSTECEVNKNNSFVHCILYHHKEWPDKKVKYGPHKLKNHQVKNVDLLIFSLTYKKTYSLVKFRLKSLWEITTYHKKSPHCSKYIIPLHLVHKLINQSIYLLPQVSTHPLRVEQ